MYFYKSIYFIYFIFASIILFLQFIKGLYHTMIFLKDLLCRSDVVFLSLMTLNKSPVHWTCLWDLDIPEPVFHLCVLSESRRQHEAFTEIKKFFISLLQSPHCSVWINPLKLSPENNHSYLKAIKKRLFNVWGDYVFYSPGVS